mmetsp:Transcript_88081/g.201306  ORF Transcript_88081/g.201306 Transcript_88081/m.201306 type:complete len:261 (-) Transcript_88081:881-1663(-)
MSAFSMHSVGSTPLLVRYAFKSLTASLRRSSSVLMSGKTGSTGAGASPHKFFLFRFALRSSCLASSAARFSPASASAAASALAFCAAASDAASAAFASAAAFASSASLAAAAAFSASAAVSSADSSSRLSVFKPMTLVSPSCESSTSFRPFGKVFLIVPTQPLYLAPPTKPWSRTFAPGAHLPRSFKISLLAASAAAAAAAAFAFLAASSSAAFSFFASSSSARSLERWDQSSLSCLPPISVDASLVIASSPIHFSAYST